MSLSEGWYFSGRSPLITLVPFDLERSILGVLSNYAYTIHLSQNYQIWRGNTCGIGACRRPRLVSSQESKVPALLNSGVILYLCIHPSTQNDQIRMVTHGEQRVLVGQPHHCICTYASRGLSAIAEFLVLEVCVGSIVGTLPLSMDFSLDQNSLVAVDLFSWKSLCGYFYIVIFQQATTPEISHNNKAMHNKICHGKEFYKYFTVYDTQLVKTQVQFKRQRATTVAHAVTLTRSLTSDKLTAVAEVR